jgi:hypothetical protein
MLVLTTKSDHEGHPMSDDTTTDECPCGHGELHAAPAYRKLVAWFDEVYDDKAYRHHDRLVDLIGEGFGTVAAQLDALEVEHKRQGLYPAALAYLGAAQVVRTHADIV